MGTLHLSPTVLGEVPVSLVHHRTGTFTLTGVRDQFLFVPECVCDLWDETSRCFLVWCPVPSTCEAADQEYNIYIIMSGWNIILNTDQKKRQVSQFLMLFFGLIWGDMVKQRDRDIEVSQFANQTTRLSIFLLQLDFWPFLHAPALFVGG